MIYNATPYKVPTNSLQIENYLVGSVGSCSTAEKVTPYRFKTFIYLDWLLFLVLP